MLNEKMILLKKINIENCFFFVFSTLFLICFFCSYSMLPSIRTVPVSGHLKQKRNFEAPFSAIGKQSISNERFWRVESLRNSRRRRRSVQVNKHFMANIYAVYCAVKLVLLRKG